MAMVGLLSAVFNVVICIGIPVIVCLYLWRRTKVGLKIFLLGMVGYFVSQMCVRQTILAMLSSVDIYRTFVALHAVLYLLFMAVTAALVEESARYIIYRHFIRGASGNKVPIYYGLGHGGLEAITIGINNVALLMVASDYLANAGWIVSLAGFERISVMIAQVAFSIIVYTGKRGFLAAIILHTAYDFVIVLLNYGWSQIVLEGLLFVISLIMLFIALKMQQRSVVR